MDSVSSANLVPRVSKKRDPGNEVDPQPEVVKFIETEITFKRFLFTLSITLLKNKLN